MRQVAMLDLAAEYGLFADEIRATVNDVLESRQFINGPAVGELEKELSERIGAAHAMAVSGLPSPRRTTPSPSWRKS